MVSYCVQHVVDTSDGCGAKFEVQIVSAKFEGVKLLGRHRLVRFVDQPHRLEIIIISSIPEISP